ncbi:hypothetical protein JCM11672_21570 [Alkaliphilus crotonatoxidans]
MNKNNKKVYLFHCSRYNDITPIITMGLWGLADYLTKNDFDTKIIHTKVEEDIKGTFDLAEYLQDSPLAIGFSAHWFPMLKECLDIAREIKKINPQIYIFMGGYTASFYAQELIETYCYIDAVIKGDGEIPTLMLLKAIEENKPTLDKIPNLIWRNNGICTVNDVYYVSCYQDLKGIEYGNFSRYLYQYEAAKNSQYFALNMGFIGSFPISDFKMGKTFFLLTGKGCSVDCLFCGGGKKAQKILNYRDECMYMDDDHIIKTIKQAMAHGYRDFYVCFDPNPTKPRYTGWLRKIQEEKLDINIIYGFWGLPSQEVITKFKRTTANLIFEISPETISEKVRRKVRGFYFSNEELYQTIERLQQEEIYTWVYFSYPLPYETEDDVEENRKAFWKLNSEYAHYIEAFYLRLSSDPASPLFCQPEQYDSSLTIDSLSSYLEKSLTEKDGNITVHRIHSIPEEKQKILFKKVFLDNELKNIFKYALKYLVMAFGTVTEFMQFIDGFYEYSGLMNSPQRIAHNERFVLKLLKEYAGVYQRKGFGVKEFLSELLDYLLVQFEMLEEVREEAAEKGTVVNILHNRPFLKPNYRVIKLQYDFVSLHKSLILEKKLEEPKKLEKEKMYLYAKVDGETSLLEINETLYAILNLSFGNELLNTKEVAELISREYTDDYTEKAYIVNDLITSMKQLYQKGVIDFKQAN